MSDHPESSAAPRGKRAAVAVALVLLLAGFLALGAWQLQRRVWKLALIERVEARVHAPPVDAPARARWPAVEAASDEYQHVRLLGRFLDDRTTHVRALTDYGSGTWEIVPLRRDDGEVVLVNRGFVADGRTGSTHPADTVATTVVTGLLRISEPNGSLLESNAPAKDRWVSRDVAAIARARGLGNVAPYFVDEDAGTGTAAPTERAAGDDRPIGGLTVIAFRNDHLTYAITWFVLAALCVVALWRLFGTGRRAAAA